MSRIGLAVLLTWGCLQAGVSAGSIRDEPDLVPNWRWRAPASHGSWHVRAALAVDTDRDDDLRHAATVSGATVPAAHGEPGSNRMIPPSVATLVPQSSASVSNASPMALSPASDPVADGPPIAPVPEPSGVALAVTGLGALALAASRRGPRDA